MVTFKVDNLINMKSELKVFIDYLKSSGATDDEIFASKLVSCELITNVIRHGGDAAQFAGNLNGEEIVIRVTAESLKGLDVCRTVPDVFAESGRGLYIVRSLCEGELQSGDGGEIKAVIKRKNK